jgi:hypothetical protein
MPCKGRFRASKPKPVKLVKDKWLATRFASERRVLANGFTINPSHANLSVQAAITDTMSVAGTMYLEVMVQGFKHVISFLVIPMAENMDLIIGNDWLRKHKAALDYEQSTISFWHNGKHLVLKPIGTQQPVKRVLEAA